jgi:dolichyl-phosphate beta-glucosyltransferase
MIEHMDSAGRDFEIVVVDDGSTDGTARTVRDMALDEPRLRLVSNPSNMGKGHAVRCGIRESSGDIVLMSDADLSTPIEEFDRLLPYLDRYDLVLASRSLPESNVVIHQPAYRETMGRIFNLIVRWLIIKGIIDTQCGFKLMKAEAGRRIEACMRINRFSFDVEMILVAKRLGYTFTDVPVKWLNSGGSRVHPVKDSFNMLLDLFRIKLYDIAGLYRKGTGRE